MALSRVFVGLFTLLTSISALNVVLTNDDGFASAQLRETYRLIKAAGHNALVVAPVDNESGQGGRATFTTSRTLQAPSEFNIIPAGAPSFGTDPADSSAWYYNGTPAAVTFFALDYVVPRVWGNNTKPDLIVAGPNFGTNLGPFLYTLSGTIGASYAAIGRGIPAIAFSAGNGAQRSYTSITNSSDPATIQAQLAVSLVQQVIANAPKNETVLPQGYGINVNTPFITSATNNSCVNPPFYQTRLTGSADIDRAVYNATSGLFTYANIVPPAGTGVNVCINGDCNLPGETEILNSGCRSAVSIFTVDYDAPSTATTAKIRKALQPLVQHYKGSRSKRDERRLQTRYRGA